MYSSLPQESEEKSPAVAATEGRKEEEGKEDVDSSAAVAIAAGETKSDSLADVAVGESEGGKKEGASSAVTLAEKKQEPEPNFEMLSNPARVLPQQVF